MQNARIATYNVCVCAHQLLLKSSLEEIRQQTAFSANKIIQALMHHLAQMREIFAEDVDNTVTST